MFGVSVTKLYQDSGTMILVIFQAPAVHEQRDAIYLVSSRCEVRAHVAAKVQVPLGLVPSMMFYYGGSLDNLGFHSNSKHVFGTISYYKSPRPQGLLQTNQQHRRRELILPG